MTIAIDTPTVETDSADALTLTVFSKNNCPDCESTKGLLTRKGVPFTEINVEEDTEPRAEFGGRTPLEHVVETYGRRMPTIVLEDGAFGDWWAGSRPDKLMATIKRFTEAERLIPEDERESV